MIVKIELTNSILFANMACMESSHTPETSVDTAILRKAGLTESQAKGYLALIEHGELTPVELAEKTGESRTNGYMICEKLEQLGLATKKDGSKAVYTPAHPSALELLAEKRRKAIQRAETEVKQGIDPLINMFYAATETPGTRTLQGVEGIKSVYTDTLHTKSDIRLIRSRADVPSLGEDFFIKYRQKRADQGIHTHALTPYTAEGIAHVKEGSDEKLLYHRTFMPENAYEAPVEIDIYGNKTVFIAFGDTQMATIIDSPLVADAMRQLHCLLETAYKPQSDNLIASIVSRQESTQS